MSNSPLLWLMAFQLYAFSQIQVVFLKICWHIVNGSLETKNAILQDYFSFAKSLSKETDHLEKDFFCILIIISSSYNIAS